MTPRPFNQGDEYEHQIYQICCESHILPAGFKRAGASAFEPDIVFIHKGQQYSLEVKADKGDGCLIGGFYFGGLSLS